MMEKEQGALMDAVEGLEGNSGQSLEPSGTSNVKLQRGKCTTLNGTKGGDIFVFGHDKDKMELVVGHALFDIISTHSNKIVATLIINGPKIGPQTSSDYLKLLSDEFSKHPKPDVLVINLKGFTSDKYSSLEGSGFVDAKRATGLQVIIICCCNDFEDAKHARIWREFRDKIFVPSREDEEPWINENDEDNTGNSEMVATHDATNATYGTVNKKTPQWTRNNEMMAGSSGNHPGGKYVNVEIRRSKIEKIPLPIHCASEMGYFTMTPVLNEPSRARRKSVIMGHEQPVGEERESFWTLDEPDFDSTWGRVQFPVEEESCWNQLLDWLYFALRR